MADESNIAVNANAGDTAANPANAETQSSVTTPQEQVETAEHSEGSQAESRHRLNGVQKRISRLVQQREAAHARANELEQRLREYEPAENMPPRQAETANDDDDDSAEISGHSPEDDQVIAAAEAEAERGILQQKHLERVQAARSKYDDYDATLKTAGDALNIEFHPAVADTIRSQENSADITYHLMKIPQLAHELAQLPPRLAVAEVGRIAGMLAMHEAMKQQSPETPPASVRYRPPQTVTRASGSTTGLSDNMPIEDWVKERNKQALSRR